MGNEIPVLSHEYSFGNWPLLPITELAVEKFEGLGCGGAGSAV